MIGDELVFVGGSLELDIVGLDGLGKFRRLARVRWLRRCIEEGGRDLWTS